jgi:hypothetical protein
MRVEFDDAGMVRHARRAECEIERTHTLVECGLFPHVSLAGQIAATRRALSDLWAAVREALAS